MKILKDLIGVVVFFVLLILVATRNPDASTLKTQPATWETEGITVEKDAGGNPLLFSAIEWARGPIFAENGAAIEYTPNDKIVRGVNQLGQTLYWLYSPGNGSVTKVTIE
jgi:hypothetical protein